MHSLISLQRQLQMLLEYTFLGNWSIQDHTDKEGFPLLLFPEHSAETFDLLYCEAHRGTGGDQFVLRFLIEVCKLCLLGRIRRCRGRVTLWGRYLMGGTGKSLPPKFLPSMWHAQCKEVNKGIWETIYLPFKTASWGLICTTLKTQNIKSFKSFKRRNISRMDRELAY